MSDGVFYNAIGGIIPGVSTGNAIAKKALENKVAKVVWQYNTQFPNSIKEFKIYMRDQFMTSGGDNPTTIVPPYTLISTIPGKAAFDNGNLNNLVGYVAFIEDIIWNRNESPKDIKIIAYHNDAGFSLPVVLVLNPN